MTDLIITFRISGSVVHSTQLFHDLHGVNDDYIVLTPTTLNTFYVHRGFVFMMILMMTLIFAFAVSVNVTIIIMVIVGAAVVVVAAAAVTFIVRTLSQIASWSKSLQNF